MLWRSSQTRGLALVTLVVAVGAQSLGACGGPDHKPGLTSEVTSTAGNGGATSGTGVGANGGEGGLGGTGGTNAGGATGTGGTATGGSGGEGGTSPVGMNGDACAPPGLLGCVGHAQSKKLICGDDKKWGSNGSCAALTLCDTAPGPTQGTCQPVVAVCQGKVPGEVVCDGTKRVQCGPDLVTSFEIEACAAVCLGGACVDCHPGDKQCTDNTPQSCDLSGNWVSGSCAGQACVAGACVGICTPGGKQCSGNQPQLCDPSGQWQDSAACPATSPICTLGSCAGPSCVGLPETCGPNGNENCCAGAVVPGGTFNRSNDLSSPATVSAFWLDRFKITVGRFRKFVADYPNNKPKAGDGAHPLIPGSGWDPAWDVKLPVDQAALKASLACEIQYATWTNQPSGKETLPINCISWLTASAFCAWDGQRLPTETEWNFAAAGGAEQRQYPWGAFAPDATRAVFDCTGDGSAPGVCSAADILPVGQKPLGDGKWGQADLAGLLREWTMDWYHDPYANPCVDCALISDPNAAFKAIRGGAFPHFGAALYTLTRTTGDPNQPVNVVGARCGRTL